MKRVRRTRITVEHCRVVVDGGGAGITESVACPDCGRVFVPGQPIGEIASCSPAVADEHPAAVPIPIGDDD